MSVHIGAAFVTGRAFDLVALRGQELAGLPVGRCSCGGWAYVVDVSRAGRLTWLTCRCGKCAHEVAMPGHAAEQLPEPALAA